MKKQTVAVAVLAVLIFSAGLAIAAEKSADAAKLEVTYYYLPG